MIQRRAIGAACFKVILLCIIEHLGFVVGALAIYPGRRFLIQIELQDLSRLILVIVDDHGLVGLRVYDFFVGVGGLHCDCLNNYIFGRILEVGVDYAEVFCVKIHDQSVI